MLARRQLHADTPDIYMDAKAQKAHLDESSSYLVHKDQL